MTAPMSAAGSRRLPDFLVIGAYKCGTTTLHHLLRSHPDVFVPSRKEANFFAGGEGEGARPAGAAGVRTLQDYARLFADAGPRDVVGEVSPEYLVDPSACGRIRATLPEVRLVAILRDPVERAWSDYLMYVRDGRERADFATALDEQQARARQRSPMGHYVTTGFYGRQLTPYVETFGRERLHVLLLEDLVDRPTVALSALCTFLGVDPQAVDLPQVGRNASGVPRTRSARATLRLRRVIAPVLGPVIPERLRLRADAALQSRLDRPALDEPLRARLTEVYRDDVALLERLLGRDLGVWHR